MATPERLRELGAGRWTPAVTLLVGAVFGVIAAIVLIPRQLGSGVKPTAPAETAPSNAIGIRTTTQRQTDDVAEPHARATLPSPSPVPAEPPPAEGDAIPSEPPAYDLPPPPPPPAPAPSPVLTAPVRPSHARSIRLRDAE